jgi:hypothetical protein
VDHARTAFPLAGKHAAVACAKCHTQPALDVKPRAETCAACHADPHKGVFRQDCASCHTESGFEKATFDHSTTRFPLVDKHAGLACAACHTGTTPPTAAPLARPPAPISPVGPARPSAPVRPIVSSPRPPGASPRGAQDFRGLSATCVSCHADVHRGELGAACEQCHTARTFAVTSFAHAKPRPFFEGEHRTVACAKCHAPAPAASRGAGPAAPQPRRGAAVEPAPRTGFTTTATACASCHQDVHLGQVGSRCESCHAVDGARFALVGFSHETTTFPLTGKHAPLLCDACHKKDTRDFPAGRGTATRLTDIGAECVACHTDPHAGQLVVACQTCHTVQTFALSRYTHRNQRALRAFFAGRHLSATCSACHKPTLINASRTPVPSYRTPTACVGCHTDVHRGALGPNCASCHRL